MRWSANRFRISSPWLRPRNATLRPSSSSPSSPIGVPSRTTSSTRSSQTWPRDAHFSSMLIITCCNDATRSQGSPTRLRAVFNLPHRRLAVGRRATLNPYRPNRRAAGLRPVLQQIRKYALRLLEVAQLSKAAVSPTCSRQACDLFLAQLRAGAQQATGLRYGRFGNLRYPHASVAQIFNLYRRLAVGRLATTHSSRTIRSRGRSQTCDTADSEICATSAGPGPRY